MKKLAKLFVLGVIACSCVNEAYDLENLDGTAVILKDVAMPIGNLDEIKITDIMSFDGTSMVSKDSEGNLFFQFKSSDSFAESIEVKAFEIPFTNNAANSHTETFETGPLAGKNGSDFPDNEILLPQQFKKAIHIDATLPPEVVDAEYVELAVSMNYTFKVSEGKAYVKKDFNLSFPEWMTIAKADDNDAYSVTDNVVKFDKEVSIEKEKPFELKLLITKVEFPKGTIQNGNVNFDEADEANMIEVNGNISMKAVDFPIIPATLKVEMALSFKDFTVKKSKVSLDMSLNFAGQSINLPAYPDFFTAEGLVFDINDIFLNLNIKNNLPVGLELDADFQTYKGATLLDNIHIGANPTQGTGTSEIIIPAKTENTQIQFSKLGKDGAIALPAIGEMLTSQPDKIQVSDVTISSLRDWVVITPGDTYDCSLGYELYAPLAFGKDFRFKYDMDFSDLAMDLTDYGINTATLSLNVTNSIPLNFALSAKALDESNQPVEGLSLEVVGDVAAGVHGNPSKSAVELRLKSDSNSVNFNSLALSLTATGPGENHLGTSLNEKQGLKIEGLSLRLPEGATVDLDKVFAGESEDNKE